MAYKRTFIAIKIPLTEELTKVIGVLKNTLHASKIYWINENYSHITLNFLGNTSPEQIETVKKVIGNISKKHKVSEFELTGLGVFKHNGRPAVIWAGTKNYDGLIALQKEMALHLEASGFLLEKREFRPHLTLGRIKTQSDKVQLNTVLSEYKNIPLGTAHVDCIHYFESILKQEGPEYKLISSEKLSES